MLLNVPAWLVVVLVTLCPYLVFSQGTTPTLTELRRSCQLATQSMDAAESMQSMLIAVSETEPVALGYKAMAEFLIAHHSYNPITKFRCFSKGKLMLERAIVADKQNIELRYLRMAIQTKLPSLLSYHDDIAIDKKLLMDYVLDRGTTDFDPQLRTNIRDFLLECTQCTEDEKALIRTPR